MPRKPSGSARIPDLAAELRGELLLHVDEDYLRSIRRLVPTECELLGVRVPMVRAVAKDFAAQHPELTLADACALMDRFAAGRCREEMLAGTFLLIPFVKRAARTPERADVWGRVDPWIDAIENWETCDQLAANVTGPIVAADLALAGDLDAWAASPNPWRRRAALVTAIVLNQKGRSHPEVARRIIDLLRDDREPYVRKAVTWALREVEGE